MTTQAKAGRGGGVRVDDKAMLAVLRTTRKSLVSLARRLESMLDDDLRAGGAVLTNDQVKEVHSLIHSTQKAMQTVSEIEGKLTGQSARRIPDPPVINMEEARAEIERRLARLAA
ncbi:hypothetical protein KHP62_17640 [Rhodobacteraceae bacterium NNCM2]|nr:hypothetical protein [Coraliihabitans acroporae]